MDPLAINCYCNHAITIGLLHRQSMDILKKCNGDSRKANQVSYILRLEKEVLRSVLA